MVSIPIDVGTTTINRIRQAAEAVGESVDTFIARTLEEKLDTPAPVIIDYSRWALAYKYYSASGALEALYPELIESDKTLAALVERAKRANKDIGKIMKSRWDAQSNGAEYEDD